VARKDKETRRTAERCLLDGLIDWFLLMCAVTFFFGVLAVVLDMILLSRDD
jgi:hypothetical protein